MNAVKNAINFGSWSNGSARAMASRLAGIRTRKGPAVGGQAARTWPDEMQPLRRRSGAVRAVIPPFSETDVACEP